MSLSNTKPNGLYPGPRRNPLHALSLNHAQPAKSTLIDPRILDDDPEFLEDAEPEETTAVTTGVCHFTQYTSKEVAFALWFTCDPDTVSPLNSLSLPRAWIPYLRAVRVRSQGTRALRDYYPLPEQHKQFDQREALYALQALFTNVGTLAYEFTGRESINLDIIPKLSDEEIPPVPLPYIMMAAILGSPSSSLTERQIKLALIRRFPYFAERLPRNSRWQISVNWILSKYRCFEPVARKPTPDDDGCAYRVVNMTSLRIFIYAARVPGGVTWSEIPVYPFFPIDYGETIGELALKPKRPARQRRALSNSILWSPAANTVAPNAEGSDNLSPQTIPAPQPSCEVNSRQRSDGERGQISSVSQDVNLTNLMLQSTETLGKEYRLAPLREQDRMEFQALPPLSDHLDNLRRTWPDSEIDEPPVLPERCPDLEGPSLWTQCLLFESIKEGSDQVAKRKLARGISKQAHQLSFGNSQST